jgi:hypothetical protein
MATKKITKKCPVCQRDLPLDAFGKDKTTKDGLYRIDKECDRKQQKAWRMKKAAERAAAEEAAAKAAAPKRRTRAKAVPAK